MQQAGQAHASTHAQTHAAAEQVLGCRELSEMIANHLPPNEAACTLRPLTKATAASLRGPQYTTIRLSQPCPHGVFAHHWCNPGRGLRSLYLHQRPKLLCLTAASGSIRNLEAAWLRTGCPLSEGVMSAAAVAGKLDVCQWLRERGCPWSGAVATAAAGAGQLEVCRWLHEHGCSFPEQALDAAAKGGHRRVCEWLVATHGLRSAAAVLAAAEGGHVGLMDWLLAFRPTLPRDSLVVSVAAGCDLATLQRYLPPVPAVQQLGPLQAPPGVPLAWQHAPGGFLQGLHGHNPNPQPGVPLVQQGQGGFPQGLLGHNPNPQPLALAPAPPFIHAGQLPPGMQGWPPLAPLPGPAAAAQGLVQNNPARSGRSAVRAAAGSPTPDWRDKVQWLLSRGHARDPAAFEAAAAAPDGAERIAWLREQGFILPIYGGSLQAAAREGNTAAVQYLLEHSGMRRWIPTNVSSAAAKAGHLGVLQALHSAEAAAPAEDAAGVARPPVQAVTKQRRLLLRSAAQEGHLHLVAWLAEQLPGGTALEALGEELCVEMTMDAVARGDAAMLGWMAGRGCLMLEWVDAWAVAVGAGASIDFLERLHGLGCRPMGAEGSLYTLAACNGDLDTLDFLRQRAHPWDQSGSAFAAAVSGGAALPALRWLLGAGCPLDWGLAMQAAGRRGVEASSIAAWLLQERDDTTRAQQVVSYNAASPLLWSGSDDGYTVCAQSDSEGCCMEVEEEEEEEGSEEASRSQDGEAAEGGSHPEAS